MTAAHKGRHDKLLQRAALLLTQRLHIETLRFGGSEELLDSPAQTVEADDAPCIGDVVDLMGGEQPPMCRLFTWRGIDLARIDHPHRDGLWQLSCSYVALAVLRFGDLDFAEANGKNGRAGLAARNGRQLDRHLTRLRPLISYRKQMGLLVGQKPVLGSPHQLLDIRRLEGKALIDVAFTVLDDRHTGSSRFPKLARAFGAVEPAPAVLLLEGPLFAYRALATAAIQEEGVDKAQDKPARRFHGNQRMHGKPDALLVHPNGRRVLDRKYMTTAGSRAGPCRRCAQHLSRRHLPTMQKTRDPHLAGSAAAKRAHAASPAAIGHQPAQQIGPPFSRRSSPNRPSPASISHSRSRITTNRESDQTSAHKRQKNA